MQPTNLSEIENLITSLVADAKCACHIINPNKTRLLMWKEVKNGITTYHLKIGIQKFTSQPQQDRNGEPYWRFWTSEPKEIKNNQTPTHDQATDPQSATHEQSN